MTKSLLLLILILIFVFPNLAHTFEVIKLDGKIVFYGIHKIAGLNSLELKSHNINMLYPHKIGAEEVPLVFFPKRKEILLFKIMEKPYAKRLGFHSLKDHSFDMLIDLEKYYGPYSIDSSIDGNIVVFSCIKLGETTYFRNESDKIRGQYNYNKSIIFYVDLKDKLKVKKLNVRNIRGNIALSNDGQKLAFDYIKLVQEGQITYDEILDSGVGIISLNDRNDLFVKKGVSFYKWSPNGDYVSCIKEKRLTIASVNNKQETRIEIPGEILQYAWSPDSKYIVLQYIKGFYGVLSKTVLIDIVSGKTKILLRSDKFLTDQRHLTNLQWVE